MKHEKTGEDLKDRRLLARLSKGELSEKSGVSLHLITKAEKNPGGSYVSDLDKIAYALDSVVNLTIEDHE